MPVALLLLALVAGWSWAGAAAGCPAACDCRWRNGKEAVACVGANLSQVPAKLDAGTQLLDLSGNHLSTVPADAFRSAGLLNLQKVFLARCRIQVLDKYAFRKLKNLVELDLSYNALSSVPSHVFASIPELRELRLSGNPIQRVLNDAFAHLKVLVRLELSSCRLGTLEPRAFWGLDASLEWLKLDDNRLSDVDARALTGLKNLHGLELSGNAWNCTCRLRPLREWMLANNVPCGVPAVCAAPPRLAGKPWDRLDLDELACVPGVEAFPGRERAVEGGNATLACRVLGIPAPNVRWLWRNRVIGDPSTPASPRKVYVVQRADGSSNLTIIAVDAQDAGSYTCRAENKAGRAEASLQLTVEKRPPGRALVDRLLVAAAAAAAALVLAGCLLVACLLGLGRRRRRWQPPGGLVPSNRREESYEKIEMNHKVLSGSTSGGVIGTGPGSGSGGGNVSVSVSGGPTKYHHVPTMDAPDGDEEDVEDEERASPISGTASPLPRLAGEQSSSVVDALSRMTSPGGTSTVSPRTEFSSIYRDPLGAVAALRPDVPQHLMHRQAISTAGVNLFTSEHPALCSSAAAAAAADKGNYPDLLEISASGLAGPSGSGAVFCTMPRRRAVGGDGDRVRSYRGDSQSPLLPESRYGSEGSGGSSTISIHRRASVDSYSSYPSMCMGRSSSTLNLASHDSSAGPSTSVKIRHRPNPSLPTSPVHERSPSSGKQLCELREDALGGGGGYPRPSTVTYDYHAAQLERFLNEYRNLHEQLCRMKQSCEGGRPGPETPGSPVNDLVPRSILKRPGGGIAVTPSSAHSPMVPTDLSGAPLEGAAAVDYGTEPPPYWLPRNTLLRRFSGGDFFQE